MTGAAAERSSRRTRASWALRTYLWVVVAGAVGLGTALPLVTSTPQSYRAETVVEVDELSIDPVTLPAYARAVFAGDAMRGRVVGAGAADDATGLRLVPRGEIRWGVEVRAAQPRAAVALADTVAAAFVEELNRAGRDVGTFSITARADLPGTSSSVGPPVWAVATVGVVVGAAIGVLVVALVVVATRPVLRAQDVTRAARQPLIGVVTLPAGRALHAPDPAGVRGLGPVSAALLPRVDASVVVVSHRRLVAQRRRLVLVLALSLAQVRDVFVSGSPGLAAEAARALGGAGVPAATAPRPGLELVDGVAPLETLEVPQWPLPVLLVIRYGEPSVALRRLAEDCAGEEMLGVVMVEQRGTGFGRRQRERSAASR